MKQLTIIISLLFFAVLQIEAQDQHIDQSADKHKHSFTFTRHVNSPITTGKIDNAFNFANELLQNCDAKPAPDQDVACQIEFARSGSIGTFSDMGLDVLTTCAERTAANAISSANVKVVSAITISSSCMPATVLGFAGSGSSMVIVNSQPNDDTGYILLHEFGHNQSLPHRSTPGKPIMAPFIDLTHKEVNQSECVNYHSSNTTRSVVGPNRPVDIGFIIDDTGSMSQEIGAVRAALTLFLNIHGLFSDCSAYQLTTFKDNFTHRDPTTDLTTIKNQVSGLFASGGGGCPEASAEALNAAGAKVKDGGLIILITDAAPHPGQDIAAVANALKSRGVRVFSIVSGDCSAVPTIVASTNEGDQDMIPFSGNNGDDTSGKGDKELDGDQKVMNFTALEAFSFISSETGGKFAFVPEVNSNNANDRKRYENIIYNMIVGGTSESVAFTEPRKGNQGATFSAKITGINTHFDASSSVAFSGTGITVNSLTVLSPTEIDAEIAIAGGAGLGFRDILATSDLSGGGIEEAEGVGAFEVIGPDATPSILSISPSSGKQGQTLDVKIFGGNTHFDATSVLSMGSGITINSTTPLSSTELMANILIDGNATVGFRSIVIVTGSEIADENVIGPFFVELLSAGCEPPAAFCKNIDVFLDFNGNSGVLPASAIDDGSTAACGLQSIVLDATAFDCDDLGPNPVNLTIEDINGATSSCAATVTVKLFEVFILEIEKTDEMCPGFADGAITVHASAPGAPQVFYSIDGGSNFSGNNTFSSLSPGTYDIVVQVQGLPICFTSTSATGQAVISAATAIQTWYKDIDNDGYSDGITQSGCSPFAGYKLTSGLLGPEIDCNDADADQHPGQEWYKDLDNDGYSDGTYLTQCIKPSGYKALSYLTSADGDCNDSAAAIHPNAPETCNGIDDDCNAMTDDGNIGNQTYMGNLYFSNQAQIDGFAKCFSTINGNVTISGAGISNLNGLLNIANVTGNISIQYSAANNLTGLNNLETVGGSFTIFFNSQLASLEGLNKLMSIGASFYMYYNFNLSDCCAIYNLLNSGVIGGSTVIFYNKAGCQSIADINVACSGTLSSPPPVLNLYSNSSSLSGEMQQVTVFPNPTSGEVSVMIAQPFHSGALKIMDLQGKMLFEEYLMENSLNNQYSLGSLPVGVYMIHVILEGNNFVEKIVIK